MSWLPFNLRSTLWCVHQAILDVLSLCDLLARGTIAAAGIEAVPGCRHCAHHADQLDPVLCGERGHLLPGVPGLHRLHSQHVWPGSPGEFVTSSSDERLPCAYTISIVFAFFGCRAFVSSSPCLLCVQQKYL